MQFVLITNFAFGNITLFNLYLALLDSWLRTDRPTDRQTDRQTGIAIYRAAIAANDIQGEAQ